ncbi:PREDICTED: uncharacterized protein LOC109189824 [Ipomoea nil]|uniref:uncharacterized protein LOC109189824 n=1 Tax=Ipomoea nil TaxID=35883 RepID=UPI0009012CF6|nr:PREDICTED: uncharacterized protein LOC109189824 [Ipomoea nil]
MANAVRNIIIKLGSKTHSPEVAFKNIQTLLQFAMKKKLKLDPLLRVEILVTVMSNYPEFYAEWSEDDATELLMMVSEASDEVSPVSIPEPSDGNRAGAFLRHFAQRALESAEDSRRRAESQPLYPQAAQDETRHRLDILRNRSNNSDSPIEISPDKPDDFVSNATPSCVPVNTKNLSALNSEKPLIPVDPSFLPLTEPDYVKNDVLHVHSVSPVHSPSKETRISKGKNIPVKVVVESGDDTADTDQPEKKRKSSEPVKTKTNPPIQQVFKTLRSSVKQKSSVAAQTTVVPPSSSRKGKPALIPEEGVPQFVSPTAQAKWSTMVRRDLIVQRCVDENHMSSVCDVLPLLKEVGLLKSVSAICPYSKLLTYKFYCNLNDEVDNLSGVRPMQNFIRGKWYVFGPDVINEYYGLQGVQEDAISDWDVVAKIITGGQDDKWPTGDKDTLPSSQLTSKYVILHRLALHNWLPSAHFHTVGKQLASLLFRIETKMTIDLGAWIYYHILTLIHPREQNVRLPFPNLIYGILTSQGLEPMESEVISPTLFYTVDRRLLSGDHICDVTQMNVPSNSEADTVVDDSPHARDLQLSIQLKARVSELETVHGIIAKQLTGARTELATVLLRLSLTEATAADPVKSESETPSNA